MRGRIAFSLVELSIVLVILGLLVGGVLTGQSLIRASELRSVTTQYQQFLAATQSFRDKYFALPGDMSNATAFWGAADGSTGNTAACASTASTDALTCNGNGDGSVSIATSSNEYFRFWQHLANAGLITGNYSGIQQGTTNVSTTTANAPSGKISNSLWLFRTMSGALGNASIFDYANYGNTFEFGAAQLNADPATYILKPEELWNIDSKLDDGMPGTGKVAARDVSGFSGVNCTLATASSQITAGYNLARNATTCVAYFRQAF